MSASQAQLLDWMMRHPPASRACNRFPRCVRMVLDTNVSLDLIVFRDPRWNGLRECIAQGACDVVTGTDCRIEFAMVLAYPQFGLDPERRVRALQAFDAMHRIPTPQECIERPLVQLPHCRDPDDQKFMQLALESGADMLLSRDKALLKLARRNRRQGLFEILSPQTWLERLQASAPDA